MDIAKAKSRFPRKDPKKGLYLTVTQPWYDRIEDMAKELGVRPSFLAREFFAQGAVANGVDPENARVAPAGTGGLFDGTDEEDSDGLF